MCVLLVAACTRPEIPQQDEESPSQQDPQSGDTNPEDTTDPEGSTTPGGPQVISRLIPVLPESGNVPEISITVTKENWNALLEAFEKDNNTQEYIPANISYKEGSTNQQLSNIGLRLKGNTSRRDPGTKGNLHHVHFGLNFGKYVDGQKLLGVKRLDLKWFKDDAAYCREVFCYDLFNRAGVWTAVSTGYVRLWVTVGDQQTYMGVYELMEHVKSDYLKRRKELFGGKDGHLWKANWGADLKNANANMGADDNKTTFTYELKSDETQFAAAKAQLQAFITDLNNKKGEEFFEWADETIDVPLLLKTYAVNVAVGMWDDYWNNSNNYYFYFNPAGRFYFIPYDYDNTLGTSQDCGVIQDSGRKTPLKWGHQSYPLLMKILEKPEWKALYVSYLKELCEGDFKADVAMERIKSWHQVIGQYVSNDTGEDMIIEDRPAEWGNHGEYRILEDGSNNFFKVKAGVINAL